MTLRKVWEKYKHLDRVISDPQWADDDLRMRILRDCWQEIKAHVEAEGAAPPRGTIQEALRKSSKAGGNAWDKIADEDLAAEMGRDG
jgi:hypothetical protein